MYPPPPEMYDQGYDYYRYNGQYNNNYMSRQPYPNYNRYDIPDYRDYPSSYGNDIENRYLSREIPTSQSDYPRRRMIYYAYLPEVVRSPPTVDLRYRSYDRFDKYDPYYYDSYFDRYDPYVGQSR